LEEKKNYFKECGQCFNKKHWAFVELLIPPLLCPLEKFEEFIGEFYDYDKHIKPVIDSGYIYMDEFVNCFQHSKELEKSHRAEYGIVKDYDMGICYIQFNAGSEDPNKDHKKIMDNFWL
jgi:hypothetical protein